MAVSNTPRVSQIVVFASCRSEPKVAVEDPFSVLSAMVPDPPSRPALTPLYPPSEASNPEQQLLPALTSVLSVPDVSEPSASVASQKSFRTIKPTKRRHWVINRNAPARRAKEVVENEVVPAWKTPRDPVGTDYGTFATLPGVLVEERKVRDVGTELGTEEKLFDVLRDSLTSATPGSSAVKTEHNTDRYWQQKATEADAYIRDVVYGGIDGLAYVRSVAEFLTPSEPVVSPSDHATKMYLTCPLVA